MKYAQEFSLYNKTEIFYNQFLNKYINIEESKIPFISSHLQYLKLIPHKNNLIPCPYCINCYIHPSSKVSSELSKRFSLNIENNCSLFDLSFIRPGEYDYIRTPNQGGTNSISNGVIICSQCSKQKNNLTLLDFFNNCFISDGKRYYKKNIMPIIEILDIDFFNKRCFKCNQISDYKICINCASKKNEIICIAH